LKEGEFISAPGLARVLVVIPNPVACLRRTVARDLLFDLGGHLLRANLHVKVPVLALKV